MGKVLMLVGAGLLLVGAALTYAPWLLGWFGRLPGDLRIKGDHTFVFIPLTSMILVSMLVTLLINLFLRK